MLPVYLLAFSSGFLSLSQEILWIRLFSFVNHSLPQAFAFVLLFYLLGIALGAHFGKNLSQGSPAALWELSGYVLVLASFFDFLLPWYYVLLAQSGIQILCGGFAILLTAFLKAVIFPIAHHLGTPSSSPIGKAVSRVYVANIFGATLGPLLTGMFLLAIFTTQQCFMLFAILSMALGLYCLQPTISRWRLLNASFLAILVLSFVFVPKASLLMRLAATPETALRQLIETPQGIISIYADDKEGDKIFGGNVYDGRTNLDPLINSNILERIIILAALHEQPKRVLMIGLSIGSWLKILTSFPGVEQIEVVEINPGYLQAIKAYPRQQTALLDPRVHIHIDDGRRWLKNHSEKNFDLVIMNTTYHWRAYLSNLLSQEFLNLIKQRMNEHALFAYNTTSSLDAFKTATTVFPHAYLYRNFVIAADFDWRKKLLAPLAEKKLLALSLDGKPLFPRGKEKIARAFLALSVVTIENAAAQHPQAQLEVITDDNLLTEYKHGRSLFN